MVPSSHTVRERYVAALLAGDATRARHLVDEALDGGLTVPDVFLDVLGPAMAEIGELWHEGSVSVAREHLATTLTAGVVAAIAPRMRIAPYGGRLAVLACTPGEEHALGLMIVGEFLEGAGWEVLQIGAGVPPADLLELVIDEQPDLVGLSTSREQLVPDAERLLAVLGERGPDQLVVVGGHGWDGLDDDEVRALGADARLRDPVELVGYVTDALPPVPEALDEAAG